MADGNEDFFNQSYFESEMRKQAYKELLTEGSEVVEHMDSNTLVDNLEAVHKLITKSNELISKGDVSDRVGRTTEVVLDAQVIRLANNILSATAQKMENDNFSEDAYITALLNQVTDDNGVRDWSLLDRSAATLAKGSYFGQSMYGTFDFDVSYQPPDSQRQRQAPRRRAEAAIERKPTTVSQKSEADKGSAKVKYTFDVIKKAYEENGQKPIPYYKLVIDPTNMMYSFDNSFQLSFLFRDSHIAFVNGEDGLPAIIPLDPKNLPKKPAENKSFVSRLDMPIINKYIAKYNIKEAMLNPPRD